MTRWEYRRIGVSRDGVGTTREAREAFVGQLNEAGAEGWELVSSRETYGGESYGGSAIDEWSGLSGILKRPRED
jgi:hypothetical protein